MAQNSWTRRDFLRASGAAAGLLAGSGLLMACSHTDEGGDLLETSRDRGYIRVGFAGEAPYAFKEGGELTGQDPAVHREIWKALGIDELRETQVDFGQLIPGLNARRFDVVAAGMFILPERCAEAVFSEPVYCAPQAFLVPAGNPDQISDYESVAAAGITMAVLPGAVEGLHARELGVSGDKIAEVSSQRDGLAALESGRSKAFALTSISLRNILDGNPDVPFELTEPFVPVIDGVEQLGCGGAVFRKGADDKAALDAFNGELAKLKESGKLGELMEPFGFGPETIPPDDLTTEKLCQAESE